MSAETNAPTAQPVPRPPLALKSTRRLSISFRKIKQTLGTITHVDIFTGSLTGTSERFAASLAEKAIQRGAIVSLKTLEEFHPECFYDPNGPYHSTSRVTVFVVSTHFAGGSSPNAEAFSQWLRLVSGDNSTSLIDSSLDEETGPTDPTTSAAPVVQPSPPSSVASSQITDSTSGGLRRLSQLAAPRPARSPRRQSSLSVAIRPLLRMFNAGNGSPAKPKNPLHGVQYAVFGVGNSMYLTYNAMGKFVDARLQAVGATRLCPLGLGDVSNDIEDAFVKWEAQLLQLLVNQKPGPSIDVTVEARQASFEQQRTSSDANLKTDPAIVRLTSIVGATPPASKTSSSASSEAKTPDDPARRPSGSGSSSSSVASLGSASKFCVRDHYGRYVRLRFRCKFVTVLKADTGLSSLKLPAIAVPTEQTRVDYLLRRRSSLRRHATHIRHPCISLQSITMLKHTSTSSSTDRQVNASALTEVSLAKLAILDPELVFETADTFGYFPPNAKDTVETIGSRLGLDMEAYVELSFHDDTSASTAGQSTESEDSNNKDRHLLFPSPCKIRTILSDFLELRAISREFVRVASGFVTNPKEHELLENLASIDGSAAFTREFGQTRSGLIKLLELAPSLRMPFEVFVNITPLLKPRLYSIASSHLKNDREFELVVALGDPNAAHGLAVSNFRRILSKSDVTLAGNGSTNNSSGTTQDKPTSSSSPGIRLLRGFVMTSRFKTPADLSAPMILIANGIGVAPLRALLQHRELESGKSASDVASQLSNGKPNVPVPLDTRSSIGKNLLLLGCANKASVLFESELRSWESNGFLELHIVYSAEPGQPMQYVQDLVATQKQQIAAFMSSSPEAKIYICGKVAMARAVNQILAVADTSDGDTSWYQKALQSGRYIEGIFG